LDISEIGHIKDDWHAKIGNRGEHEHAAANCDTSRHFPFNGARWRMLPTAVG
jgi:hypothetical protein